MEKESIKALIIKGKGSGKIVEISQWCNDWFTVNHEDPNIMRQIYSPSSLVFTVAGIDTIIQSAKKKQAGTLFWEYQTCLYKKPRFVQGEGTYIYTFKKHHGRPTTKA